MDFFIYQVGPFRILQVILHNLQKEEQIIGWPNWILMEIFYGIGDLGVMMLISVEILLHFPITTIYFQVSRIQMPQKIRVKTCMEIFIRTIGQFILTPTEIN